MGYRSSAMMDSGSTVRRRETLWASVAVAAFSVTGWTYFNIGFGPSFLPLLAGIFAIRRLLALEMAEEDERHNLIEWYDIDLDREYTVDEQVEILSEVEDEYEQKGRIWGVLGTISAAITIVAVPLSLAVAAVCAAVAGYCLIRYVRLRRLRRTIEARIDELSRRSGGTSEIHSE